MDIKFKNSSVHISSWLIIFGLIIADGIYANYCRKKIAEEVVKKEHGTESVNEEESK